MAKLATPEGTRRYAHQHADAASGHFRETLDGLLVSSIGFGSYLGDATDEADARYTEAFVTGLRSGVNVLDTAANYRGRRSERAIGRALREADVPREAFVLATKAGYLPGEPGPLLEAGVFTEADLTRDWHVMTPDYVAYELGESLATLGVDAVDVHFLHNPEAQLGAGIPRRVFEARLKACFERLEAQRREGRIGVYGLATWTGLRVPPNHPQHVGLERALELATEAGGEDHGLRAIELPYNMGMPEAAAKPTQPWRGALVPALHVAHEAGLLALGSASLLQTRLLGRIDERLRDALHARDDVQAALQFARSTQGLTTALVGTGSPEHAKANAAIRALALAPEAVEALLGAP